MISLKFIPLSFITSKDEIIKQIKNTVVFSHLFETCEETTLNSYIESTQYGFTASALENGSHKMLRITDINHGKVDWENVPFCDCENDEKYLLEPNDILVARTGGTTGKSFIVQNPPSNAVYASYLIRIRLKDDVSIEFINAFLNSYCFWSQITEMKSGSAQPNVNAEKLKTLVIPNCDLETQSKAVDFLNNSNGSNSVSKQIKSVENLFWNNDEITTELSHQLELVSRLRQAFLREAMQGKLVPQDASDEPAAVLLEKIKAEKEKLIAEKKIKKQKPLPAIKPDEIPFEIPNNWTWCRLNDACSFIVDCPHSTPKYTEQTTGFYGIDTNCINDKGEIVKLRNLSEESYLGRIKRLTPTEKDIVYSREGSIGLATFIPANKNICLGQRVMLFRPSKEIYPEFLKFCVIEEQYKNRLLEKHRGIGAKHVNVKDIVASLIPLPPLAEQKRIVEKLEKLMKFCDELETNIRESATRAETLLQVALKEALEPKQSLETFD